MDDLDRKIIAELQRDGRLTVTQLAARVHLGISPCHRRLRELERSGTIRGYRAIVDPSALGLAFATLVFVTMRQEDRRTVTAFEKAVVDVPEVVQAQRLFGDPDFFCGSSARTWRRTSACTTSGSRRSPASSASPRRW